MFRSRSHFCQLNVAVAFVVVFVILVVYFFIVVVVFATFNVILLIYFRLRLMKDKDFK